MTAVFQPLSFIRFGIDDPFLSTGDGQNDSNLLVE